MAVLSANLKSLLHLRETPNETGEIFSIRNWIQNDKQDGFLFLTSRADQHETLKPLISTWTDIAINTLLSLEQSDNRNIWIIVDELPSLNYLPSLHSGLAESRQFGGRFVLALQLPAQLKSIYGDRKAEATSGLCGTRIILRTPDEDTATWCSNNLGKTEIEEVKQSISFGASELKDGVSLSKNIITKSIVSPTEIMNLDNLNAYVKLAGDFPITKLKFNYKNYPKIAEKFIERKTDNQGYLNDLNDYDNLSFNDIDDLTDSNDFNNKINSFESLNNLNNKTNIINNNLNTNTILDNEDKTPHTIKLNNLNNNCILSPELKAIRDNLIKQGKIVIENDKVDNNIIVDDKIDNISKSDESFEDL